MRVHNTVYRLTATFCFILASATVKPHPAYADWQGEVVRALKNGGAIAVDSSGKVIFSHRADEAFIPASTLKVATAAAAFSVLGPDARFKTEFYVLPGEVLGIKGYGDPSLVSEEIAVIAGRLAGKLRNVRGIQLDASYFANEIAIDGASDTTNPYDAVNGSLAANYNTVYLERVGNQVRSAEPQTPLTPIAQKLAKRMKLKRERFNLGTEPELGPRYFAELLTHFLKAKGVSVAGPISFGQIPASVRPLYTHQSSTNLAELVRSMLEFSTNFIANQLYLALGAKRFGAPATTAKGNRAFEQYLHSIAGLETVVVGDGAGLSRKNQISPRQLVVVLRAFSSHLELLPEEEEVFRAKTGSLTGVNSLAGYFRRRDGSKVLFAILVNDRVPFNHKFVVAKKLYAGLH